MPNQFKGKAQFSQAIAPPPGGVCLSSFVIVNKGPKAVLLGKMKKPETWVERFFVGEKFVSNYASSGKYLMPASHLGWYESPLDAVARVLKEQLQIEYPKEKLRLVGVQNHLRGDVNDEQDPPHWDICFVYEAKLPPKKARELRTPEWFEVLEFVPSSKLTTEDFTRGHGDVLQEAGRIGPLKHGKRKS